MQIKELKVTVGEVCEGYFNDAEEGVVGYDKRLDIRPKYQREFVYKDAQRDEVIRTVMKGLPLNVMYWCKVKKEDGSEGFEVLDGQQRTISLCEYVDGTFSVDDKYFYNLPADKKQQILDYPLFVYVCDGTDSEKLEWFRIINIAGEELTDQELRNAVYAGSWTSDAKRYFSKTGCAAGTLAGDYLKGASIRQEYLETAIFWAASAEGKTIEAYMAEHQNDPSAVQLWNYFRSVIDWVEAIFPKKRKEMKGLPWGLFYNQHGKRTDLDPKKLETEIQRLMGDEDVTKKSGIYEYLLTGQEKKLSIRSFDRRDALAAYEKQGHMLMGYQSAQCASGVGYLPMPQPAINVQFYLMQIAQVIEKIGYMPLNQDGFVIYVEKSPAAISVAESEQIQKEISYKMISYNHHSMRGKLQEKKNTILKLAELLEAKRTELAKVDSRFCSDIFYLFNNLNIRHNNVDPSINGKFKQAVADMPPEELEHWYDETYQMCLLAFLRLEQADRKIEFDKLKSVIEST